MTIGIGILVFDGVEELDFTGPWEVFAMANEVAQHRGLGPVHELKLIAEATRPVVCAKGLRERGDCQVLDKVRYVQDGNIITAAGVSAGIDMALWLTGELHSPDFARAVQRGMEYEPVPPYAGLT